MAADRLLLQEVELLVSIDPAFAELNGIPPQFDELAALVEDRLG